MNELDFAIEEVPKKTLHCLQAISKYRMFTCSKEKHSDISETKTFCCGVTASKKF